MLLCTKSHFIKDLDSVLDGTEGPGSDDEKKSTGKAMEERIREYASDASGNSPQVEVWTWHEKKHDHGSFVKKVEGKGPLPGQRVVYVDGSFDLFSTGHIEFLQQVVKAEEEEAKKQGWDKDYSAAYVVAGIRSDDDINQWKGINYPIMNIFERGLCVLQCKVRAAIRNHLHHTYTNSTFPPLSSRHLPCPTSIS